MRLGKLALLVLAGWVVADLALRFAPPTVLQIDPWLYVSRFPARYAPFSPNRHFHLTRYVGGNALMANLTPTEFGGPIDFSTDSLGFRMNPYLGPKTRPQVLLFKGDSFTYGVGLSDGETLASVLTRDKGVATYNGGRFHDDPEGLPELDWLSSHLPSPPRTVVYVYLEHWMPVPPAETGGWKGQLERHQPRLEGDLYYGRMLNTFFWQLAPTKVVSTRVFKRLSNGVILPNVYRDSVKELKTPDGGRMLFRDYEYELAEQARGPEIVARTGRYFKWFQGELARRNINLVVLMVPARYTIYAPLLGAAGGEWTEYLNDVEHELRRQNIAAVNCLTFFREHAPEELREGRYSFYREDTHWNPSGVRLVADHLSAALEEAGRPMLRTSNALQ